MSAQNHERAEEVFLAAAELPEAERSGFLDSVCAGDCVLREEVESLLRADSSADEIVEVIENEAQALVGLEGLVGARIGAYRVTGEIGHGGMGTVYLAIRDDDQYQKQVAIKLVRPGMDTQDVLERFRHERQILANLDHPNIARLLDAGTVPGGSPFFVMEYVKGQPLDDYCRERKPGIRQRCRLFLQICEAVAYAHCNLVVHRDLKPANILVTPDGSPKLLDFGVAKILTPGAGLTATALTRPFTPEYASPEQVRGLPVTTASDVYSLGAVFYELLTGQRAQKIAALTPLAVEHAVCDTEAPRPSLLAPHLDRDLDNIVRMAMRKEPERRYQSVDQLTEDIRRHLSGRPVVARQDSFRYRTTKFLQRNRFEMAGVAVVFASLVTGLMVSISQSRQAELARRGAEAQKNVAERERSIAETARAAESTERVTASQQRDEAVRERARAEQRLTQLLSLANKTLFDIHDSIAKLPGATEARRELVKTTLDYLETIERESGLDDRTRLVLSLAYFKIAGVQGAPNQPSLGDFEDALKSYRKAEALLAPLYERSRNDPEVLLRWIEVEAGLADLTVRHFQRQEGIAVYSKLLPIAHKLAALRPTIEGVSQEAVLHGELSKALQSTNTTAALEHANRQLAIVTELTSRFPGNLDLQQELGAALAGAASSSKDAGDLAASMEYFERSVRIREQVLQAEPNNVNIQRNLLVVYGNYATLLGIPWSANLGHSAEARTYCEKAIAMARRMVAADPADQTARYDLAMSLARLGMVEPGPGGAADSLKSLQEALAILDPIAKANPNSTSIAIQVALARQYAGTRMRMLGQPIAAAECFRLALADLEGMINAKPNEPFGIAQAIAAEEGLAELYAAQGDRGTALDYANRAVSRGERYSAAFPGDNPRGYLANAYFVLASVQRTLGDGERAGAAVERALSLWRALKNPGTIALHKRSMELGEALLRDVEAGRVH